MNHVDMEGGEGLSQMSILLHKTCFEKWSTKGVKNIQKKRPHDLWMTPKVSLKQH